VWLRVETGPDAGKVARVVGETFVVGRSRRCDLVLAGEGVDGRHARLELTEPGRYALTDLDSERGTFVAGRRIGGPVPLRGDEQLCFGDTFAQLLAIPPSRKRRRRMLAVAAAVGAVVAAAGVTAGILAPRTGGGPADAVHHAAAPPAPPAPAEPAAATVAEQPPPEASVDTEAAEPAAEPPPATTEAEPGRRVVFREDFSDPQSGWEVFSVPTVTAGYDDGSYAIRITDPTWYATVDSGRAFRNPSARVTVQNAGRAQFAGFGLLCNYRDEQRFDVLAVGTDGTYAILEERGGVLTVISEGGAWARSAAIPVGAERYRLRADCRGQSLRLWVNGRLVGSARTQSPGGRIGLFAAGLAEFRFDDLVVRSRT
jgi:hypothetical protein